MTILVPFEELAFDRCYKPVKIIVVNGEERKAIVRWSGFMYEDVAADMAGAKGQPQSLLVYYHF